MVRPRGRPPTPRGVFSFEDPAAPIPDRLTIDTSFAVEALLASQGHHPAAASFLATLAENGTELVFSRLLSLELRETAFQIGLKERHPKEWKRFRHDGRARPRAARLMRQTIQAWDAVLQSFVWIEVGVSDVASQADALMADHGLASYDAVHAATAIGHGGRVIVTLDAGFASVPESELTVYVDRSRLATCRGRRG